MSLDTILVSIAGVVKTTLPELSSCEVVGGRFSLGDKQRMDRHLPAGFVSCLGTSNATKRGGKVQTVAQFFLGLAHKDLAPANAPRVLRAHAISRLAGRALYAVTYGDTWGHDDVVSEPTNIDSRNLYSIEIDSKGVALWGITWEQTIALELGTPPQLDDLLSVGVDWTLHDGSPPAEPDAQDLIDDLQG